MSPSITAKSALRHWTILELQDLSFFITTSPKERKEFSGKTSSFAPQVPALTTEPWFYGLSSIIYQVKLKDGPH